MRPAGLGALMAMLEKRKAMLQAEGLFDPARKKPLPFLPEIIGVVTSPSGAVIRDILHRLRERFPRKVLIWPVAVQGKSSYMNTKDKIIQTSISLFNEHGERAISTNHIASSLGMSPGNLYYHFKNKEDIIRHIFALYRDHLSTHFKPVDQGDDAFERLGPYLDSLFELMWRYHFFYDNLGDILARDSHLKQEIGRAHV